MPVCTSFDTNGRLEMTSSVWKQGCQWNYNNDDPTHNILFSIGTMCSDHFECDVPIDDGLTTCNTDRTYDIEFNYTETYWCHYTGLNTCNKLLASYKTERYFSVCGALYWAYTCHSKFPAFYSFYLGVVG